MLSTSERGKDKDIVGVGVGVGVNEGRFTLIIGVSSQVVWCNVDLRTNTKTQVFEIN